jgi:hypothetical protein
VHGGFAAGRRAPSFITDAMGVFLLLRPTAAFLQ